MLGGPRASLCGWKQKNTRKHHKNIRKSKQKHTKHVGNSMQEGRGRGEAGCQDLRKLRWSRHKLPRKREQQFWTERRCWGRFCHLGSKPAKRQPLPRIELVATSCRCVWCLHMVKICLGNEKSLAPRKCKKWTTSALPKPLWPTACSHQGTLKSAMPQPLP